MEDSTNNYLNEILNKFNFILAIWVTDYEGGLICGHTKEKKETSEEQTEENKMKVYLSYLFNSALDQISRIEKWKTKSILTIFGQELIFQSKLNKTAFVHFVCSTNGFNYELIKEIVSEIEEKLQKIEKEIENLTQNSEAI